MAFRKLGAIVASAILAAGIGSVVGPAPAQASVDDCTYPFYVGYMCEWTSSNYSGLFRTRVPVDAGCQQITYNYPRAALNYSYFGVRYWSNSNCTGSRATIGYVVQVWNFGFNARSYEVYSS